MPKLTMTSKPEKAAVNNSGEKAVGVELYLDQIIRAKPFESLFAIKSEVLAAIVADMKTNGYDASKPVNVWKTPEGKRILIDGYTRVKAAEELGFMRVTAYEKSFGSEAEALAYAIHTQRDRRNLTDGELLHLIDLVDKPQEGFKAAIASSEAIGTRPLKTAEITAAAVGTSRAKVERARVVRSDPEEARAVMKGEKTINQAAKDVKAKRDAGKPTSKASKREASKTIDGDPALEAHEVVMTLKRLMVTDQNNSRRSAYRAAVAILNKALE